MNEVDEDGSGKIEFKEFLEIMSSGKKNDLEEKSVIYNFFKSKNLIIKRNG